RKPSDARHVHCSPERSAYRGALRGLPIRLSFPRSAAGTPRSGLRVGNLLMRVAIAASGRLGTSVMLPLLESSHTVVALVQDGRQVRGLKRWLARTLARFLGRRDNILRIAARRRLPVIYIDKM